MSDHVKKWAVGLGVVVLLAAVGFSVFGGKTTLQKGTAGPLGVASCEYLTYAQCQSASYCNVINVPQVGTICVNAGVSCTYSAPTPAISGLNLSEDPYNPDSGRNLNFTFGLNVAGPVWLSIYKNDGVTLVKQLANMATFPASNSNTISWNGDGVIDGFTMRVPEGTYKYAIRAGATATPFVSTLRVTRSRLELHDAKATPNTIDGIGQTTQLSFISTKTNPGRVYAYLLNSSNARTGNAIDVTIGGNFTAGRNTITWNGQTRTNTTLTPGTYQVTFDAGIATVSTNVTIARPQITLTNVRAEPDPAVRSGTTDIKFSINRAANVNVLVLQPGSSSAVINQITGGTSVQPGNNIAFTWNLLNSANGQRVAPGRYEYVINARALGGSTQASDNATARGYVQVNEPCGSISNSRVMTSVGSDQYVQHTITVSPSTYSGNFQWSATPAGSWFNPTGDTRYLPQAKQAKVKVSNIPSGARLTVQSPDGLCRIHLDALTGASVAAPAPSPAPASGGMTAPPATGPIFKTFP